MGAVKNKYGSMSRIWLAHRLFIYIDRPEDIEIILNSQICLDKGDAYGFVSDMLGNGLVTLDGIFVL